MRLDVKIRTLCLAGVGMVAALVAGEALARGGGRSGGGHWIGGGGHGHHWGGGVHGGRASFGGGRRTADFGGYWGRGRGGAGDYWGGYYGGGGVYYGDGGNYGNYGDYASEGPPAYRRGANPRAQLLPGAGLPGSDRGLSAGGLPQLRAGRVLWLRPAHYLCSRDAASWGAKELQPPRGVRKRCFNAPNMGKTSDLARSPQSQPARLRPQKSHAAAASNHNPASATR